MSTSIGTRVVMIGLRAGQGAGRITAIRNEPYLRPFVVDLDSGERIYASASQLALEADPSRLPLGPALHED